MVVGVASDARSDDQVEHGHLVDPVLLSVLGVLLGEDAELLIDELRHLVLEALRKLLHKLHALTPTGFGVTFFQVIFDVDVRLVLILVHVLLCERNVRQDQSSEDRLKVLPHEILVVGDAGAIAKVAKERKNKALGLFAH